MDYAERIQRDHCQAGRKAAYSGCRNLRRPLLDAGDAKFRAILLAAWAFPKLTSSPLYFRTTDEMLKDFGISRSGKGSRGGHYQYQP
jgi:hypothetical protein